MSEQAGRYQRSAGGMIGALIVTVAVIAAYIGLRALNREEVDVRPDTVDYLDTVATLQESGRAVAYPPTVPEGWRATSIDVVPGDRPAWGLGVLTGEGAFVGVRQADESVDDLVEAYVDEQAAEGDPISTPGALAPRWETWTDEGGDVGYAAEVDGETVLVYGSAGAEEVRRLLELLTTEPTA
ncbi:DUF4245 domain-containing protein [uncultured Nocardioides sp.]|uniref:DUF4245 domain-containing protein n=1 Tax=uncultured Nocardioides sp. TaxID=198441 RepID=UPI0025E27D89|nr:DUF4245 domain-containing protein [uncultured Nocardioides sp.]